MMFFKKGIKTKWRAVLLDLLKEMEEKKTRFASIKHVFSFLDAMMTDECNEKLKSAVETLKAKQEYVFNYLNAWKSKKA